MKGGFELGINNSYESISKRTLDRKCLPSTGNLSDNTGTKWGIVERKPSCVGYSEIDKYAVQIYEKHFKGHKNYGDITKIDTRTIPDFDLFVGGFPCQAFSIAGKRRGFEDTRGTLFFEIARILKDKRPRYFVLENVKGLLSHDEGNTFKVIISTLDELGYFVEWQVLNSKNFGVPQNRERVFIIGHLGGQCRPKVFPIGESNKHTITVDKRGETSACITKSYYKGHNYDNQMITTKPILLHNVYGGFKEEKPRVFTDFSPAIRRLTPIECERLQGFPCGWTEGISDTQRYKTLGNAVTVNVIEFIMGSLLDG